MRTLTHTHRSLDLDSWKPWELKAMYVGGNDKARKYFRMQGVRDMNGQGKYNSKAARLYKKQIQNQYSNAKTPPTSPATGSLTTTTTTTSMTTKGVRPVGGDEGLDRMLAEMGLVGGSSPKPTTTPKTPPPTSSPSGNFSLSAAIAHSTSSSSSNGAMHGDNVAPLILPAPVVEENIVQHKHHSNGKLSAAVLQKDEEALDRGSLIKLMRQAGQSKRKGRRRKKKKKLGGVRLE